MSRTDRFQDDDARWPLGIEAAVLILGIVVAAVIWGVTRGIDLLPQAGTRVYAFGAGFLVLALAAWWGWRRVRLKNQDSARAPADPPR